MHIDHMTATERQKQLEATLSDIAKRPIEITVRGLREFTFSFEGESKSAMESIKNYFAPHAKSIETEYDLDCDFSAVYVTV